jgi:hypothetical protein
MPSQTVQKKPVNNPDLASFSGDFPPRETRSLCLTLLPEKAASRLHRAS